MAENDHMLMTRIEVLTGEHHLVGDVRTAGRRFSTWLNLDETRTLTMHDAALRSLSEAQRSYTDLGYVLVNRDAIVAVILREESGGALAEPPRKPLEYVDKERHEVVVSAPPYGIKGYLHVARSADLHRALGTLPGHFVPLTKARLIYTPHSEFSWEGEVVLVNRARAHLFWPASTQPLGEGLV